MKTKLNFMVLISIFASLGLLLSACISQNAYEQPTETQMAANVTAPPGEHVIFASYNQDLKENLLVDEKGETLYNNQTDPGDGSLCNEQCKATWNPLVSNTGHPVLGDASLTGKLDTIELSTGVLQVRYNGKPLYVFAMSMHPSDISGNGYGGQWFVATP